MSTDNSEDITTLSAVDIQNTNFDATGNNHNDNEIQVHIKTLENKITINI